MHGVIQKRWNVVVIKRMRKQCIPGSLSPPPREPGYKASVLINTVGQVIFYFQDSKQKPEDRSTLLLSSESSRIAMSYAVNVFVHAIRKRSKKCLVQKVARFFYPLHGFPRFKYHLVALVLLYNMRLKQSFSIERFKSYTTSKIRKVQCNRVVFLCVSLCL